MSIEAFQIATAVFGATTVGLAHLSYGLRQKLKESAAHVANLQGYVSDQCKREGALIRERDELLTFYNRTMNQRQAALRKAHAKNKASADDKQNEKAAATAKTLSALEAAPLRPRDEVVANIRFSKAAQEQLSSAN